MFGRKKKKQSKDMTYFYLDALKNKQIPVLVLDPKWHELFPDFRKTDKIKKLEEHGIIELKKENNYYILDDNNLDELELSVRNQKQGNYIVEYNSNEIIYTSGIKDKDGNILYKLSDIEKVK